MSRQNLIDLATEVATKAHQGQFRKGTDIPYITHPFAVGILLARSDCSEEIIAAGILHDVVEDTQITLEYIYESFGERIASIVKGCTEPDRSLSWEARKEQTIVDLVSAPFEVKLVTCADKLHNIKTVALEHDRIGDDVWSRFNRGREAQAWYYQNLASILCNGSNPPEGRSLFRELKEEVENLFGSE